MSFDHLLVHDIDGQRRVAADALPLRFGTGADSDIRLPGPGGGPVVLIDLLDGAPFAQPVGRDGSMTLNGEPLVASRRLEDGDTLAFFGSRIEVSLADGQPILRVRLEDSAYVTRPPELPDTEAAAREQAIAPAAFRRVAAAHVRESAVDRHWLRWALLFGLGVLGVLAWLLFTSRSIAIAVTPESADRIAIRGGWFRLPLGNRVLLREGDYSLEVEKAGYYDLRQAFTVDDTPSRTIEVRLRRRPGEVTVYLADGGAASVTINGSIVGTAPLGPIELPPGEHSLEVRSERYLPFTHVFTTAGLARSDRISVQRVPRWAEVSITSAPSGARILANDEVVGTTPAVIELLEGEHALSVVLEGYKAWDGNLVTLPNEALELPLIALQAADARLLVNTVPKAANVTVDGRYRGQSPITIDLAPEVSYTIGLSKAGYGATTREVRLAAAASEQITVDLSATTGRVTVKVSPTDATVYVGGRARGTGTMTLDLSAAPKRIEVRKPGYETWHRTITPRPGYPQTLSARLRSEADIAAANVQREQTSDQGHVLRRIEPGAFRLGASRSEAGRRANEVIVPVRLTKPFLIGVHEVNNKQFAAFDPEHDSGTDLSPTMAGERNPAANVTWAQAVRYLNWLSAREGLNPVYKEEFGEWVAIRPFPNGYRLPTEAEWVWAMRYQASPEALRFPWGEGWPPRQAVGNFADRAADGIAATLIPGYDDGFAATSPVASFPANAAGLHDGGGNVAEWVNDYYTVPTPGQTQPLLDPLGPERGRRHVIRGSSFRHGTATELRLSYRDQGENARPDVGFRIARNLDPASE